MKVVSRIALTHKFTQLLAQNFPDNQHKFVLAFLSPVIC
jgi:hypothetical protein